MPTAVEVVQSLQQAADAASDAFDAAVAANPSGDFSKLHDAKVKAVALAAAAINKALDGDPAVADIQKQLDAVTNEIRSKLDTLQEIQQFLRLLNELVRFATQVSKFFV
jgi:regulator of sirC expression with transglutaminase-like and TPR domain